MYKKLAILGLTAAFLQGCASVNMESDNANNQAKNLQHHLKVLLIYIFIVRLALAKV